MWHAISKSARMLGDGAAAEAQKAKIKADILLIDRSMDTRKRAFGVAMYDYLSPLSQSQDFYAANDKLTEIVRPILITAQKEIQALASKRVKQKETLAQAEAHRAAAFPQKAETYGQTLMNLGKATYLHSGETKIKTQLAVTDRLIKGHKEDFGVALYDAFAAAEDNEGFLPTDRQIRNVYDTCRQDLTVLQEQRKAKEEEIVELGGQRPTSEAPSLEQNYEPSNSMTMATNPPPTSGSYSNPTPSYGATTTPQSTIFTPAPTNQNPPAFQVAGSGMFSHPVPSSGGFSDNVPSMSQPARDPFASMNQGYNNPTPPLTMNPDPFATFSTPSNNYAPPPSSSQQRNPHDLLDF